MISTLALTMLLSTGAAAPEKAEKPKLVVLELQAAGGIDQNVAGALSEAVVNELANRGFFEVVSSKEVATMLGFERQKQMLGCAEDGSSCLTELAGAMGARFVFSGTVARLGEAYQLSLQTLDSTKAQPIGRSVRLAENLETLTKQLPYAVAEATATPLPPPPSRIVPYTLMGTGAAAVLASSALGLFALQREGLVNQELSVSARLEPLSVYRDRAAAVSRDKTLSLAGIALGAALIGTGLFLNPAEVVSASGGASASLVPSTNGIALVGVMQ